MNPIERYRGSLLGMAVGDALGTTLEFRSPGSLDPIDDILGGGCGVPKPHPYLKAVDSAGYMGQP
jgi:ADP-ribosylglycohydrolase